MDNNIDNALLANDKTPVGTILAWAGAANAIPKGYLICNGESISKNQFPDLCNVLQDCWGPTQNDKYALPDLRAMVLRGVNQTRHDEFSDPEANTRTSANARSNDVGSFQHDAFQGHWHNFSWSHDPSYGGPNNCDGGDERNGHYVTNLTITDPINDGKSGNVRTSSETRPKNAYVYYIIKAV